MPFIQKLMLRGIRSYSPTSSNTIEFHTPLTLILGPNGSGKTTIIEALKYATTGNLPPNTKNGAFIYDPKLLNEAEVKAQVKLKFINTNNQTMVCTRSMQVAQKRNKVEQRTLESVLWTVNERGEQVSISGKCANIDKEMPYYLGVSSAVLENVIFCHQEESTWVLDEPKIVKKKMDDLFESTKVIKAIELLKGCKREFNAELKLKKQEYEFILVMKNKNDVLEMKITNQNKELIVLDTKLKYFGDELKKFEDVQSEIRMQIKKLEIIEMEQMRIQIEIEGLLKEIESFKGEMFDEEDVNEINKCDLVKIEAELEEFKIKVNKLQKEFAVKNEKIKIMKIESERMKNCKHQYNNDLEMNKKIELELDTALNELKARRELQFRDYVLKQKELKNEFDVEIKQENNLETDDFIDNKDLKTKENADNNNFNAENLPKSTNFDGIIGNRQNINDRLKEEIAFSIKLKHLNEKDMKIMKSLIEELENEKKKTEMNINQNNFKIYHFKKNIIETEKFNDFAIEHLPTTKEEIESKIFDTENEIDLKQGILNDEFMKYEQNLENEMKKKRLNQLIKDFKDKIGEEKFTKFENTDHANNIFIDLNKFNDERINNEKIILQKKEYCKKLICGLKSKQIEIKKKQKISDEKQMKLAIFQADLKKCKLEADEINLNYNLSNEYEYEIVEENNMEKEMDEIKNSLISSSNAQLIYKNLQKMGIKNNECPICKKEFCGNEKMEFITKMENVIEKIPIKIKESEYELNEYKKVTEKLEQLNKDKEKKNIIIEKIKKLIGHINELTDFDGDLKDCLDHKIEKIEAEFEEEELEIIDIEEEIHQLENINKIIEEIQNIEINENTTSNFDPEKLKVEIKDLKTQLSKFKNERNEIIRIEIYNERKLKAKEIEIENSKINEKIEELKNVNEILKIKMKENDNKTGNFKNKENEIKEIYDKLWKHVHIENSKLSEKIKEKNIICERIAKNKELLGNYNIEEINEDEIEIMKNEVNVKMDEYYKKIEYKNKMNFRKEQLLSFNKFNKNKNRLELLKIKYEPDSIRDLKMLRIKFEQLDDKRQKIDNLKSVTIGEKNRLSETINQLKKEVDTEIVDKECKSYIGVKVLEQLIFDIDNCLKAIDKTIVEYHAKKLVEINRCLRDLWVETYKGCDIDYVELQADVVESKSYNYKMVMVKNGCELDMRSRSSAGQKMIASILVRLALSDAFTTNLSLLALDEPTTNLDQENIESLANTLIRIIEKKKNDVNFQMIIITHDECLVQLLSNNGCDEYYKLNRNANGDSIIEKRAI